MERLRSSPVARDPTLIEELRNEASGCEVVQPSAADRLREMSNALPPGVNALPELQLRKS
jgi:hypothetical protein